MELQTIKKLSAIDSVIDYVKNQLIERKLVLGQKIFGENELAKELCVGLSAIFQYALPRSAKIEKRLF